MKKPQPMNYQYFQSPIGRLRLLSDGKHLVGIEFEGEQTPGESDCEVSDALLKACASQLQEYFSGTRHSFDLPLAPEGTEFQQSVWKQLRQIPHGQTCSYKDIAVGIGKPKAVRAVGAANGRNPIPIVVPCHRVIGSDGSLTGFSGGIDLKKQLLELEGAT